MGDATGEMGPFNNKSSWYNDYAYFTDLNNLWFHRGGHYGKHGNGPGAGSFSFSSDQGKANITVSFRLTLCV